MDSYKIIIDSQSVLTLKDLSIRLRNESWYYPAFQTNFLTDFVVNLIKAFATNSPISLIDPHFSKEELNSIFPNSVFNAKVALSFKVDDAQDIVDKITESTSEVTMFTSGTTGVPKKILHKASNLCKMVKNSERLQGKIWGFTYNPAHMAGIQVILQALSSQSTLVNLYRISSQKELYDIIDVEKVDMISGTPTFYRLLLSDKYINKSIQQVTVGGEKSSDGLLDNLKKMFPNARLRNIFATTESASLLSSENGLFKIKEQLKDSIRIIDGELHIREEFVGKSDDIVITDGWYHTGDIVEIIGKNPLTFRFVSRTNSIVNVGGNKVDLFEVEDQIRSMVGVKEVRVIARKNSVTGNLISCEIVKNENCEIVEKHVIEYLSNRIADYKIPRLIKFVDKIEVSRTGKLKRS